MATPTKNKVVNGIVFTGKGYSYVLRVPDPVTGRTKPQWVGGFDSAKSAKLARDKARVALSTDSYVSPSDITLGEFLTKWVSELHNSQLKPTTLHSYKRVINSYIIPGLGLIKLQDLRPSHLQSFYNDLLTKPNRSGKPLAPKSVEYAGAVLRIAIKYAVEVEGLLPNNPVTKIPLPKGKGVIPSPWNISELNKFLDEARSHRLYCLFRLSAFTGARRGELLALRWTDIDGTFLTISKSRTMAGNEVVEQNTTKGGTNGQRRIVLDPETITELKAHKKRLMDEAQNGLSLGYWNNSGYIFVQENGLPIDPHTPGHLFQKLSRKAGLRPIRFHDLRHLHATELLRLGEPLHVVAQRLGHRDAMVTATIYAHVSDQQAETASSKFANAVNGVN